VNVLVGVLVDVLEDDTKVVTDGVNEGVGEIVLVEVNDEVGDTVNVGVAVDDGEGEDVRVGVREGVSETVIVGSVASKVMVVLVVPPVVDSCSVALPGARAGKKAVRVPSERTLEGINLPSKRTIEPAIKLPEMVTVPPFSASDDGDTKEIVGSAERNDRNLEFDIARALIDAGE
jgi:hypothetical protein